MFDRFIQTEYYEDRVSWEADGKPRGFFWHPPECTLFKSRFAQQRLSFVILFKTPTWARKVPKALSYLKRLRICVYTWYMIVLFIAYFLIIQLK
jgi:hypothetical protein